MKESVSKKYKQLFKEVLAPYGFKLYKKTFYRQINDVVQTVMLNKTSTNFTVEFKILPLCLPIEDLYCEGYDISILRKGGWWDCWPEIEKNAFEEIMALFKQNVMPIFEHGENVASAYDELLKLEKKIYTGVPGGVIHHYSLYLMSVCVHDYERAQQHFEEIIQRWDEAFQHILAEREKSNTNAESDLQFDKFMLEYQERKEIAQRLSIPDVDYFQRLVEKNEAISLECLAHPRYPGQCK